MTRLRTHPGEVLKEEYSSSSIPPKFIGSVADSDIVQSLKSKVQSRKRMPTLDLELWTLKFG